MAKGFLRTSDQQVDKYMFTFSSADIIKIGLELVVGRYRR